MNRITLALALLAASAGAALAQSTVTVIGRVTAGNCAAFNSTTVIKDAGAPCGGGGGGGGSITIGTTAVIGGVPGRILYDAAGVVGEYAITGSGLVVMNASPTINSPIIAGHPTIEGITSTGSTGSGNLVFATSPFLTTPSLGFATANTINGQTITAGSGTITLGSNTLIVGGTAATYTIQGTSGATWTMQGTDTYVGRATIDTLTNKTLTNPIINGATPSTTAGMLGYSGAFPNWWDGTAIQTFVGAATVQTLTNKTFNAGVGGNVFQLNGTTISAVATAAQYLAGIASNVLIPPSIIYEAETVTVFGATTSFDFQTFINTAVTLTANMTTQNLVNVTAGKAGTIAFIQSGVGNFTTVWNPIFKFTGGVTPVLTTGSATAVDVLAYSCRSATFCVASLIKDVR